MGGTVHLAVGIIETDRKHAKTRASCTENGHTSHSHIVHIAALMHGPYHVHVRYHQHRLSRDYRCAFWPPFISSRQIWMIYAWSHGISAQRRAGSRLSDRIIVLDAELLYHRGAIRA